MSSASTREFFKTGALVLAGAVALGSSQCVPKDDTIGVIANGADDGGPPGCVAGVPLKRRPEGESVTVLDGMYEGTDPDSWPLIRRDDYVTLTGQGYLELRWQIEYASKAGVITPPVIALASGTFLRVGGGGGNHLGDPKPGTTGTFMGNAEEGLSTMADGVPTPWLSEFYYLDGEVTITQWETDGLYNVTVSPKSYDDVATPGSGVYDPGVVCDRE